MARRRAKFTDKDRDALRQRLLAHQGRYELSPEKVSDQIIERTGFRSSSEALSKRVRRYLEKSHEPREEFFVALAEYLNQVAPEGIEESAIAFAHLLVQSHERQTDLSALIGRYQTYLRPMRRAPQPPFPAGYASVPQEYLEPPRPAFEIAYAILEMTPLDQSNALLIADMVTNVTIDPEIDSFPESPLALSNTGVLVPFGSMSFLMATRSIMESRLYRLTQIADDPLTLRGYLTLNGVLASARRRRDLQVFDPDYEVELVRVADIGEG